MSYYLIGAVILAYSAIQFFELSAVLARLSGVVQGSVMIGYSVQQAVYMLTRLFLVALLPLLGLLVDLGIEKNEFARMAHFSLFGATIMGLALALVLPYVIKYYIQVIKNFSSGRSFLSSFIVTQMQESHAAHIRPSSPFRSWEISRLFLQANLVYLIYGTGIFVSFYFALVHSDFRATISHMSGVANALGAVMLTVFVEPKISRTIDKRQEIAVDLIFALFWARVAATGLTGQIMMFAIFWLV